MLRYIEIQNIALIDKASIDFGSGLCVLTGETGAGKSIIIDSINAALGAKTARDIVRKGTDGAAVTAVFSLDGPEINGQLRALLEENGLYSEQDYELVLSRDINASGRSICRVNGKITASQVLKSIGELVVDLHGQHENHSLMKREKHIELIDNFSGADLLSKRDAYSALYAKYWRVKRQIADLYKSESDRIRMIDILKFQINEIKSVRPQPGEDDALFTQIEALANAEKIKNSLAAAGALLNGEGDSHNDSPAALEKISGAIHALSQITQYSNEYSDMSGKLAEARYIMEDVAVSLRALAGAEDLEPGRLDKLSARHESIERLKRKYGGTIKEIHKFYKQAVDKLSELTNSELAAETLEKELSVTASGMEKLAVELTEMRVRASAVIEDGVVSELTDLEMKNCRFKVLINSTDGIDGFNIKGRDQLEFLFCANPGEELKPLVRIASGGEMSRVMLAIKSVLAGADDIPTMIFDEIDNGISGNAASRVAEKMHLLSEGRQIICVTHLAQIACMADDQYLIEKSSTDDETQTSIIKLDTGGRAGEISRMLGGGAPTEASMRLSAELLNRAAAFKDDARGSVRTQ